ncbi:MAG: RnfABCDGE type electron transport complex subunit D [Paracoccus sp. (in: a-proteobacteria)]|nr:RnfABCDGE type electron transport complex subunit D [Paracoccus sp. (in: a-proteobacteria)]
MMRGIWSRETVAAILLIASLPLALAWLWTEGAGAALRLIAVLIAAGIWHGVFMLLRAQPPSLAGALTALAIAMLAPPGLGPVALILSISFGVVFGELVMGGWGRNILNPATITLAFAGFGFPAAGWPELAVQTGWAAMAMLVIGCLFGVMHWRVPAFALAALAGAYLAGIPVGPAMTAILVVLALLVADPVTSGTTGLGRALTGASYGALAALFTAMWADAAPVQLAVSAALLASLAAPLYDDAALALWQYRRRKSLG